MPKKLKDYTEKELLSWYEKTILNNATKSGLRNEPFAPHQSRHNHDVFNIYAYGDNLLKIVYIKSAPMRADLRKTDPLWAEKKKPKFKGSPNSPDERFSNSVSRSKSRIFELAMCNEFKYFCTFTQDEKLRDRFDLKEFRKDLAQLVRNLNRNRSEENKIKYLLIPEQHKNGAWHLHGLLQGITPDDLREFTLKEKLPERIRKQIAKGVKIYDWTRYRKAFGFFTCAEIESQTACAKYITKYISKDLQKTVHESGEHLFFASQGLKGRETILRNCADLCDVDEWDFENEFVKVKEIQLSHKSTSKKYTPKF